MAGKFFCLLTLILATVRAVVIKRDYKVPPVQLELLQRGFRLSIPDAPHVQNVAFNVNRNIPIEISQPGEFSARIYAPTNGRWNFGVDRVLQNDDILFLWINVQTDVSYEPLTSLESIAVRDIRMNDDVADWSQNNSPAIGTNEKLCVPSTTVTQNRRVCVGDLIFEEHFMGKLNRTRWLSEVRFPLDDDDAEFVVYDDIAKVTNNNMLSIVPQLWNQDRPGTDIRQGDVNLGARCTAIADQTEECVRKPHGVIYVLPPIITARINTKNAFSFKYGTIEIRAKLPKGDWLFPLLALEPLRNRYGSSSYASGQLRVAFARGNADLVSESPKAGGIIDGRRLYGGAILTTNTSERDTTLVTTLLNDHVGDDFHVYKMTWNTAELILEVDGRVYGKVPGGFGRYYPMAHVWGNGDHMAPFDQEFFITLGVSAGGHGDFPDNSKSGTYLKPWLNTAPRAMFRFWRHRNDWKPTWTSPELQVDYVKVWAI